MKATVAGLITPHVLRVAELARQAETGANVDWHVKDAVAKTVQEFGSLYNARDLLCAYVNWLETAAEEAEPARNAYGNVLRAAAAAAARDIPAR